jgi:hypothetical protein
MVPHKSFVNHYDLIIIISKDVRNYSGHIAFLKLYQNWLFLINF